MRRVGRAVGMAWTGVLVAYLLLPVAVMVAFGFNAPRGRFNYTWAGFSLRAWRDPFGVPGLLESVLVSLRVAVVSTALATTLGSMAALALVRYRFAGRRASDVLLLFPLAAPDVVMGAALLTLLVRFGLPDGLGAIVAAHVMLSVAYVAYTVRARTRGMDWTLEEAAMDLGAGRWRTVRTVTLPLIAPAVAAGAALAFALSIDDFTVTLFVAGSRVTFPLFVWGAARVAVPPQINVVATMFLIAGAALAGGAALLQRRRGA